MKDMFDVPDAKRVRRSDLVDDSSRSSSSPPPPPPATTDVQEEQHSRQLHLDLDFVDISHETLTHNATSNARPPQPSAAPFPTLEPADADAAGSATFEFRLFSTGAPLAHGTAQAHHDETTPAPPIANAGIHRICIRSPTPLSSAGDGAFVVPYRPQGHYLTTNSTTDPARKAAYTDAAVSSGEVLERAKASRWPGTALPWRVIHLDFTKPLPSSSTRIAAAAAATALPAKTKTRRTRAGKKRRLAIRTKYAAMTAQAETEREKRTRRNREKKVKKKEREKTKKKKQVVSVDDVPLCTDKPV